MALDHHAIDHLGWFGLGLHLHAGCGCAQNIEEHGLLLPYARASALGSGYNAQIWSPARPGHMGRSGPFSGSETRSGTAPGGTEPIFGI